MDWWNVIMYNIIILLSNNLIWGSQNDTKGIHESYACYANEHHSASLYRAYENPMNRSELLSSGLLNQLLHIQGSGRIKISIGKPDF